MVDQQYDVSPQEKQNIIKRAAMRKSLKEHYTRELGNPHRFGSGEGYLFDPAVQRYLSMKVTRYDYFRPTVKGFLGWFGMTIVPIALYTIVLHTHRTSFDEKCRRGEIAAKDRTYKFSL